MKYSSVIIALLLCAVPVLAAPTMGALWSSHADEPALQLSQEVWADADWALFADAYWVLPTNKLGAGLSVDPPSNLPLISTVMEISHADRVGVGAHYSDVWNLTIYAVYDLVEF